MVVVDASISLWRRWYCIVLPVSNLCKGCISESVLWELVLGVVVVPHVVYDVGAYVQYFFVQMMHSGESGSY